MRTQGRLGLTTATDFVNVKRSAAQRMLAAFPALAAPHTFHREARL
jgi:hypothetical protein